MKTHVPNFMLLSLTLSRFIFLMTLGNSKNDSNPLNQTSPNQIVSNQIISNQNISDQSDVIFKVDFVLFNCIAVITFIKKLLKEKHYGC